MIRGQYLDAVKRENHLDIEWFFAPKSAVIIKRGNAVAGLDIIWTRLVRNRSYKIDKARFRGTIIL